MHQTFLNRANLSTFGVVPTPEFMRTAGVVGYDNSLFAADWPFASSIAATPWFKSLTIADSDRNTIAHINAERLLKL